MEIERKFLIKEVPSNLEDYEMIPMIQGYLNRGPVIRVRKEGEKYFLTYKGGGMMARTEYNLPLDEASFENLIKKADGNIITKNRYLIPFGKYTIELDHFENPNAGLWLAEVEFESVEEAKSFEAPLWFGEDVTYDKKYHNSNM